MDSIFYILKAYSWFKRCLDFFPCCCDEILWQKALNRRRDDLGPWFQHGQEDIVAGAGSTLQLQSGSVRGWICVQPASSCLYTTRPKPRERGCPRSGCSSPHQLSNQDNPSQAWPEAFLLQDSRSCQTDHSPPEEIHSRGNGQNPCSRYPVANQESRHPRVILGDLCSMQLLSLTLLSSTCLPRAVV